MQPSRRSTRRHRRLTAVALAAGVLNPVACDCSEEPVEVVECDFEVRTTSLTFLDTAVGSTSERALTVVNTSRGMSLNALGATFDRNGQHFAVEIPDALNIPPGGDAPLVVRFAPLVDSELAARLTLSHPDRGDVRCPSVEVTLRGRGVEVLDVDAGPADGGMADAGDDDGGTALDAGTDPDAGVVDAPDGGVAIASDSEWFAYGGLEDARMGFAAVELRGGHVLVVGGTGEDGEPLDSIERLNPETGVSRVVARMALPRAEPAVALLADGRVVILGGRSAAVDGFALRTVEVFDPASNTVSCAGGVSAACLDAANGPLPQGRIGAVATAATAGDEVIVVLGRTLQGGNEVPVGGGEVVALTVPVTTAPLEQAAQLGARVGAASVRNPQDGSVLLVGGRNSTGAVLPDVLRVNAAFASVSLQDPLAFPRAFAAVTILADGSAMVAGGYAGNGAGVAEVELIRSPFAGGAVEVAPLTLAPRVRGSLLTLDGGIVLWAGGLASRPSTDALESEVPLSSADLVVPVGVSSFLRVSTDNDLAHGRVGHVGMVTGQARNTVLFLGGSNTSPRRSPHPHVERYLLDENRFVSFGLMGPGTALEASVITSPGAALVSAGGVDPHTGRTSAAVRAFDAITGTFLEAGSLGGPRRDHSATRMSVSEEQALLIVGGRDDQGTVLGSMSIFDPVSGIDRPLPSSLRTPRALHSATRLADGNALGPGAVLVCGGVGQGGEALDSCEIVVPPANPLAPSTFDDPSEVPVIAVEGRLAAGRVSHTATLLDSGEVLILGGGDPAVDRVRGDIVVPRTTMSFIRQTVGAPALARRGHAALHLGAGRVLVVGGEAAAGGDLGATRSAELYVRTTDSFAALPEMRIARAAPAVFLLESGDVIVAGGARDVVDVPGVPTRSMSTAELYVTAPDGTGTFEELPELPLSFGRADVRVVDVFGRAIIAGGTHRDGTLGSGGERRTPVTFVDFLQRAGDAIEP